MPATRKSPTTPAAVPPRSTRYSTPSYERRRSGSSSAAASFWTACSAACVIGGRDDGGSVAVLGEAPEEDAGLFAEPRLDVVLVGEARVTPGQGLVDLLDDEGARVLGGQELG